MTPSRAASRAAPKAAALTSTTQLPTPPLTWAPQNIRGYQEAPDCDTRRSQAARASSSSEPLPMRQFETFMQNLMQGLTHQQGQMGNNMAQLGSALQELARGQNQMLSLLQQTQVTFPEDASMTSAEVPQQTQGLMPTAVASTTGTSEPWELMTESGGESKSVGLSGWPAWMMAPTALAVAGRAFLRPEQLSAEALARVSNHGSIEGLVLFNGLHHQVLDRVGVCPSGDDSGDLESKDATVLQEYKGSPGEEIYEHCDPRGLDGNHGSSTSGSLKKSPCDIHHSAVTQPPAPVPLPQGFKVTTKVFHGVTRPPDTQEMIGQKSLPLWRRIVDIEAQEILENQFPHVEGP